MTVGSIRKAAVVCHLCKQPGHFARDCRVGAVAIVCQLCSQPGHSAPHCGTLRSRGQPVVCQMCEKPGHNADRCYRVIGYPVNHSQLTNVQPVEEKFCRYCKTTGHLIDECNKRAIRNARAQGNSQGAPHLSSRPEGPLNPSMSNEKSIEQALSELTPLQG